MSDTEIVTLLKEWLPLAVSGLASVLFSILLWVVNHLWKEYKLKNKALVDAVRSLSLELEKYRQTSTADHAKIREQVQIHRAEMQLMKKDIEPLKAGLLAIEGVLRHQGQRLDEYVKTLGQVEGKLSAIFKFIDAPKRATDL